MQYLTQNELRRVEARSNWQPRKLTDVERFIQKVPGVSAMINGTQAQRAAKDTAVSHLVKEALSVTSTDTLSNKVQLACYQPSVLAELLSSYPQVEFYDILNGGYEFTPIEKFGLARFSLGDLQMILSWVVQAVGLFDKLPQGLDTFIGTPHTDFTPMRDMAAETKETKYHGYSLPKALQDQVNVIFDEDGWRGGNLWALFHLRNYNLLEVGNIWKRAKMGDAQQKVTGDVTLKFNTVKGPRHREYHEVELARTSTNTHLHFCVPK